MYDDSGQRVEKTVHPRELTDRPAVRRDRSNGDGAIGFSDLAIFSSSYGYCEGDPEFDERANLVTGDDPECIDAADQSAFMSLFGLSATSVMRAGMDWDAENRLAAYIPLNSSGGAKKVTFKYDYRGRRVEKNVYAWNSGGSAWHTNWTERRRFVWNGWLMLREVIETDVNSDGDLNDQGEGTRVKTYTWGKDLGDGLESAGGIGGLLAVYDDNGASSDLAYVYMYDANGNVGQVCDLSQSTVGDSIVAKYEYDAYGNAAVSSGSYATANTYRFSTKPWDGETGLGYWGYRYYDPRLGRWMSRDPIKEKGGINLYAYALNRAIYTFDPVGHICDDECTCGQTMCQIELALSAINPNSIAMANSAFQGIATAGIIFDLASAKAAGTVISECKALINVMQLPSVSTVYFGCAEMIINMTNNNSPQTVWARAWNKSCSRTQCLIIFYPCQWGNDTPTKWVEVPHEIIFPDTRFAHYIQPGECLTEKQRDDATEWAIENLCAGSTITD